MWKEWHKYKGIINIMDGFHILFVNLTILYKKYGLLDLREWWVKSKITAHGSVDKAVEGWHYSRGTRLHKQTFEAIVHFKCKSLQKDFQLNFIGKVKKQHMETYWLFEMRETLSKQRNQLAHSGTMGKWVTNYIRDVSDFLSRIVGYRNKNIELHLQAQRELLPLLFALHHQPKLL